MLEINAFTQAGALTKDTCGSSHTRKCNLIFILGMSRYTGIYNNRDIKKIKY